MSQFILGDSLQAMKQMPDNAFELAIVDPPYGINVFSTKNMSRSYLARSKDYKPFAGGDKVPPDENYFNELLRVSKNQIVWGANHFISAVPINSSCWIVWDKENGQNDFADCELAWTSFKSAVRIIRYKWHGMLQGDMKNKEVRIHPTQKPVALYKWLLKNYAKQGDKILDTHVGSASSLIACHQMGFEYLGFEIDEEYYTKAVERLETVKSQASIFDMGISHF